MSIPTPKLISADELETLVPQLNSFYKSGLLKEEDYEEYDEDEEEEGETMLYFEQDTHLTAAQYKALKEQYGFYTPWAVNGSLTIEDGGFGGAALVKGDLICDCFGYGEWVLVQGKIKAKYYATFIAGDHEVLVNTTSLRLETPYVFSWFYNLGEVEMAPGTNVMLVCDGSALRPMGLRDPYYFWEESAFVLKPAFCYLVDCYYSDALYWNFNAIETALQEGKPIFIDGFTPDSMPFYREAHRQMSQKNYKEAYWLFQKAAELSPNFYYTLHYMGFCLYRASAYEQAMPVLERAAKLFPEKCKGLPNQAADYFALSALRLNKPALALEWSNFSIEGSRNNKMDGKKLWIAWRARGEAHLMLGNLEAAKADLEKALEFNFEGGAAHWLLGLAYHRLGNEKQSKKHHQLAIKLNHQLTADYATYSDTVFLQAPPTTVNWMENR